MPFTEAISIALASLRANKLRSLLTVLGILIGVSSVIAIVAITEGLDRYISDKVLELGTKSFTPPAHARHHHQPRAVAGDEEAQAPRAGRPRGRRDAAAPTASRWGPRLRPAASAKFGRITQKNMAGHRHHREHPAHRLDPGARRPAATSSQHDVDAGARRWRSSGPTCVEAFFETDGADRQGDRRRRPPGQGRRCRREEGQRLRREPGQLRSGCRSPPSASSTAPGARSASQAEARSMAVFEAAQDQVRVAMRVRRTSTSASPTTSPSRPARRVMELWQTRHAGHLRRHHRGHRHQPARRRDRGHEHHARLGHRAHPRDRRPQGARGAAAGHPAPVPGRVRDALRLRRLPRCPRGRRVLAAASRRVLGSIMSANFSAPVRLWAVALAVGVSSHRRSRGRPLPREPRGRPRPRRGPAERVSAPEPLSRPPHRAPPPVLFAMGEAVGLGLAGDPRLQDARRSSPSWASSWGS